MRGFLLPPLPEQEGPNYRQLPTRFASRCPPQGGTQRSDRAVGTAPATTTGSIRPIPLPIPRCGVCNAGRRPSDQARGCTASRRHLDGALRDRGQCAARRPRLERSRAATPGVVARDTGGCAELRGNVQLDSRLVQRADKRRVARKMGPVSGPRRISDVARLCPGHQRVPQRQEY